MSRDPQPRSNPLCQPLCFDVPSTPTATPVPRFIPLTGTISYSAAQVLPGAVPIAYELKLAPKRQRKRRYAVLVSLQVSQGVRKTGHFAIAAKKAQKMI